MFNNQPQQEQQQSQLFNQLFLSSLNQINHQLLPPTSRALNQGLVMINPHTTPYSSLSSSHSSPSHTPPNPTVFSDRTKLFVGNISSDTTLTDLYELFAPYGDLNYQLSVLKDDNYAFIHFYKEQSAQEAIRGLNGVLYKNRYIRVEYSNSDGHLRKINRQKVFDKKMFLYQYKNSKSTFDFNNNNDGSNSVTNQQSSLNLAQIENVSSPGLRAIRGGNSHRMSSMQTVANFRAL